MNGRYTKDIRMVFYELLKQNVSIENCEHVFKVVLEILAHKCSWNDDGWSRDLIKNTGYVEQNILHTDGTKQTGSYQVNTLSDTYTLRIVVPEKEKDITFPAKNFVYITSCVTF